MRECNVCHEEKSESEFYVDKRTDAILLRCKKCSSLKQSESNRKNPARHLANRAKARARKKGIKYDITFEDLLPLPKKCPVFGFRLRSGKSFQDPCAYSVDRLDNRKGYVRGNVAIISYLANRLKNNGTAKQHGQIVRWMRSQGLR